MPPPTKPLLVHLTPALHAYLKSEARERGVSMSRLVREAVVAHLGAPEALLAKGAQGPQDNLEARPEPTYEELCRASA